MAPDAEPRRSKSERGYLTLTALSLTTVISISLASYISLCYQSYLLSFRLFQVAQCRQLAETGLEEALWALNNNSTSGWVANAGPGSNVAWTVSGITQSCTITGYQLGEGITGQVIVTVVNYNCSFSNPVPSPTPTITAVATVTLPTGATLTKTLSAPFQPAPLFANAVAVTNVSGGYVSFGTGGFVDSWDSNPSGTFIPYSSVPTHPPTSGAPASTYAATLAAAGTSNGIILNGATVYGYAATFGTGISHTGSTLQGPSSGSTFDSSRINTSAFVPSFQVGEPASWSPTGTLTGGNQTVGAGTWTALSGLTLNGTVSVQGPVQIIVGDLDIQPGGMINISPSGRLEIFVRNNITIEPGGGFVNQTNDPKNLALYSTNPGARNFVYSSTQDFCGVMYSAAQRYTVEFQTSPNIYGAILANFNVMFDTGTTPHIHYDLALRKLPKNWFKGVATPYILLQITET